MIYISGAITGRDFAEAKAQFDAAEKRLTDAGHRCVNPCSQGLIDGYEWADYMRMDIQNLCQCTKIYMLKGWENSKGARLEHHIATEIGKDSMTVYYEGDNNDQV